METKEEQHGNLFQPIPGNTPVPVQDSTQAPYCYVGLLEATFPNGQTYFGTGTLIAEAGKSESWYVLTSAHNLYDVASGGKATRVVFKRAYNDPKTPYEAVDGVEFLFPVQYPSVSGVKEGNVSLLAADLNLDFGLVKLKSPVQVSGCPFPSVKSTSQLVNLDVQLNGYGYFDRRMSHATGKLSQITDFALLYPISTMKGSAGTAIMTTDNKTIVGINTRTGPDYNSNQGVRITDRVMEQIYAWMKK
jgi:glutamyl endopeptidase